MSDAAILLLTRPRAQSEAFATVLAERLPGRFRPEIAPLIEIAPVDGPLDLSGLQGLIFTSANGVEQFAARSPERDLPAYCVGEMTAAAARRAGFRARSADGDVAALETLVTSEVATGGGAVLHVRGRHSAGNLVVRLRAAGVAARASKIYDQTPIPLPSPARSLLEQGRVDVLAFFSPRTASLFGAQARASGWRLGSATLVSLSAATDAALQGLTTAGRIVAREPTREGMLAALAPL